MHNYMIFDAPEEHEFVYEGFGLSTGHDPNEPLFSYVYLYDGATLTFSFSPAMGQFFRAQYQIGEETVFEVCFEGVNGIKFSGWNGEKTIEVSLIKQKDIRIFYNPKPRIYIYEEE